MAQHRIVIAREQYKFSCAHMTVFPDGTKERLHGHNYTLAIAIDLDSVALADMIPFSSIKSALAALCAEFKERVLIAEANPHLTFARRDATEVELTLCGKRYVFPAEDVLVLPLDNISAEMLALHCANVLKSKLGPVLPAHARSLEVTVEESPGQGSTSTQSL